MYFLFYFFYWTGSSGFLAKLLLSRVSFVTGSSPYRSELARSTSITPPNNLTLNYLLGKTSDSDVEVAIKWNSRMVTFPRNVAPSRILAVGTSTLLVTAISLTSIQWLFRYVSRHGWAGAFRFLWQGDPYTPQVRESVDVLEEVESKMASHEIRIDRLEESLARSRLDTIDGGTESDYFPHRSMIKNIWTRIYAPRDLRRDLSQLNSMLDRQAAKVDGVATYSEMPLKIRKKRLSQQLVSLMERVDILLSSYGVDDEEHVRK